MRQGDIYMVSLDPVQGREQRGHRPVLIVSSDAFNQATQLPVVCPITNGGTFAQKIKFAIPLTGIAITGVVRCDQPKVLDLKERGARKVETLPEAILAEVLARVVTIFE